MTRALATTALTALLVAGCGGGSESHEVAEQPAQLPPRAPSSAPESTLPTAPAAPAAADAGAGADLSALEGIPTTEQLEQLLGERVTDQNADAEFEKLLKEIESEEAEAGG